MHVSRPFVVTRPAAAGQALTDALRARGIDARWLPAFEIGPAPDAALAAATLAQLAAFDLAVFVSPAAVRAAAALRGDAPWPPATAIGAVGAATAAAVSASIRFVSGHAPALIAPVPGAADEAAEGDGGSGSEAYWQAQLAHQARCGSAPRRVLLLRASHGREWLPQQFEQAGAEVVRLAVYARRPRAWSTADADWIAKHVGGAAPVVVVTSSEAVDALATAAQARDASGAALRWLQGGRALGLHPRIVERLRAAGFADVACVPCEVEALIAEA